MTANKPDSSHPSDDDYAPRSSVTGWTLGALVLAAAYFVTGPLTIVLVGICLAIVFLLRKGRYVGAASLAVALVFFISTWLGFGWSTSVRLDTGDQRYLCWGVPVWGWPMNESAREALRSVSDPALEGKWEWCAEQVGTNYAAGMVYSFYYKASAWVSEDPAIAKLIVRDLAAYLCSTHAEYDLPECYIMLWPEVVDTTGNHPQVIDGWREHPEVQAYLAKNGYVENTTP
jgi:hypothetical protein